MNTKRWSISNKVAESIGFEKDFKYYLENFRF